MLLTRGELEERAGKLLRIIIYLGKGDGGPELVTSVGKERKE